ncbi:B12-binding domain-containing protein [Methanoregula sp.]|uniref:cobalamin B12-binding domain-containing protein n=1 Tax=Methanoregula sp. TaxID=2052170 RepID=UPI0035619ABC
MADPGTPISPSLADMQNALLAVDRVRAGRIIRDSCIPGSPFTCLERLVVPALEEIGRRWEAGDVALSQVYMSGRICEEIVDTMLPPGDPRRIDQPKMAIAVLEDHHTLGKRIVLSVLRAGGFEVADYGQGVTVDQLVEQVIRNKVRILLISTLMLPAALRAKEAIAQIRKELPETKVIVGGAPFNFDPRLWTEVGADAMGYTASDTLARVKEMAGGMQS